MRAREKKEKKSQNEKNSNSFLKSNEIRNKSKNFSKWGTLGNGSQIDALKLSQSHLYIFLGISPADVNRQNTAQIEGMNKKNDVRVMSPRSSRY